MCCTGVEQQQQQQRLRSSGVLAFSTLLFLLSDGVVWEDSARGTILCILPSPLYQSPFKVHSPELPLLKRDRWLPSVLTACLRGALVQKCLQLQPVIAFWEEANDTAALNMLWLLLSSPSRRSRLRRPRSHYGWMPTISRWSGWDDGVRLLVCCNLRAPSVTFIASSCWFLTR